MPPALSPSRAADFKQCPLKYRFRTIDRLDEALTGGCPWNARPRRSRDALRPARARAHPGRGSLPLPERWTAMVDEGVGTRLVEGHRVSRVAASRVVLPGEAAGRRGGDSRGDARGTARDRGRPEDLLAYLLPFVEPLRAETHTFTREWLRSATDGLTDVQAPEFSTGLRLNLPREYAMIHRVFIGSTGVLCQLGATLPARASMQRHLPGFAD